MLNTRLFDEIHTSENFFKFIEKYLNVDRNDSFFLTKKIYFLFFMSSSCYVYMKNMIFETSFVQKLLTA